MKPYITLTAQQRARLAAAVRTNSDWSKDNTELDIVIAELKHENPGAFYREDTLILRRFYDEPRFPIPYRSHVRSYE